jgi:ABC-2 type transport system ATP-binding protein
VALSQGAGGPPAVELLGVSRRFGRRAAVRDVSLAIPAGHIFGLVGPNGSGKTTLLRIMAGLLRPDAGDVEVDGASPRERAAGIGYMAQAGGLHPVLSVWENVRLFAGLQGIRSHDQMRAAIDAVGLGGDMHVPVERLSGGMQRRASFACALAHHPRLLLLDEPTVGLDPPLRLSFWEHLRRLVNDGVTVVVTTHVMDEPERCHGVAFLRDGRLIASGSPRALKEQAGADSMEGAFLRLIAR